MPRGRRASPRTNGGAWPRVGLLGVRANRRGRGPRGVGDAAGPRAPDHGSTGGAAPPIIVAVYSSLHKIDFIADGPDDRRYLVQTDHRSVEEVEAEVELSILFALARIIGPSRTEHGVGAVVRYVALGGLHPAIAQVVASTGAVAEVDRDDVDLSEVETAPPSDLADGAFAGLARRVLEREGLVADEDGLAAFEKIASAAPSRDEDEVGYWTMVAELAAVTGEVIRGVAGGRWVDDPQGYADIPFMFAAGGPDSNWNVNAVGKAIKYLAIGDAESPRQLLVALRDREAPEGPLLFSLKPADWGAREQMWCEPLFSTSEPIADVPLMVYGHDRPNTFSMIQRGGEIRDLATMRSEALVNLARVEIEVEKVELAQVTFWVGHGDYFAAEKILDVEFMQGMHSVMGELIAAAVPEKSRLFLTSAIADPETIASFMRLVRGVHDRDEGGRRLSPTVFLVSEGRIVGVARTDDGSDEPPESKIGLGSPGGKIKRWSN